MEVIEELRSDYRKSYINSMNSTLLMHFYLFTLFILPLNLKESK